MLETLRTKIGPFPGYVWGLIAAALAYAYLWYRNKQQQNAAAQQAVNQASGTSSNLGTVPVSNLTTQAQPMPIQLGDTFVNTGQGGGISSNTGTPNTTLITPTSTATMEPAAVPQASPAVNTQTIC